MAQEVVGEHASHHGLADRDSADADAGVVMYALLKPYIMGTPS